MFATIRATVELMQSPTQALNLTPSWGSPSGDKWGNGGAWDGDGVGDNQTSDDAYPYN
eukprot:CAMPEP_0173377796 /NCGR_PEP_ID=MMETSP1356-20130122/1077_1 /TAXON_ID=77927 ORGANISM="Hemiselmis virescens, Strain PCC157" /NCGR_SAMPLE_ID=MMETSP1356 /ASSEMBLY_ACC=CAM_ASM_000847 /LENGTH=57 /DNA_ID=CAMNT_0014330677 /DNA_START=12 /DNA_END=185 /DNA_ORIENTATION=+